MTGSTNPGPSGMHSEDGNERPHGSRAAPGGLDVAATFDLAILTPEQTVFEGAVEYVQVPGTEGYLGVLAHHAALVTALAQGTLTVRRADGAELRWTVSGGFFEVSNHRATALADSVREAAPAAH